jgi:hypothetical protein
MIKDLMNNKLSYSQIEPAIRSTGAHINWVLDEFTHTFMDNLNKVLIDSPNVKVNIHIYKFIIII